jgi:isopentenyl diphosphate isomerase/L-lactate dehydrogenase-like FMN-dependent dehydrogenase
VSRPPASVADLHERARRRLPRVVYDFVAGGAEAERTLRENREAFEAIGFRPSAGIATAPRDLRTEVLGEQLSMPVLIAPCGAARIVHPEGERALARAAAAAGTVYVYPHVASRGLAEVTGEGVRLWYQLYLVGGRAAAEAALHSAAASGCRALVLTLDGGARGVNERNIRNRLNQLVAGSVAERVLQLPQLLSRPAWLAAFMRDRDHFAMANIASPGAAPLVFPDLLRGRVPQGFLDWSDIAWIREAWKAPIVAKGVLTAEAARRALDAGVDALVVSNHGGRQLDGSPATIRALEEVASAANGANVLLDGGIERGADVVKALALGATAVLIGRASLWGLACGGQAGVELVLTMIRDGIDRTLGLLGCSSPQQLRRELLDL